MMSSQSTLPTPPATLPPLPLPVCITPVKVVSARDIMEYGCLPALPPATRDYLGGQTIVLPQVGDKSVTWPPTGWENMSPCHRMIAFMRVAGNLETRLGSFSAALEADPNILASRYNMMLPGIKVPAPSNQAMFEVIQGHRAWLRHFRIMLERKAEERSPFVPLLRAVF